MCFAKSKELFKFIGNAPKQRLDCFDSYNLKINNISVNLYISRKRATKGTHIHCAESGDIIWEQFYPFGVMSRPAREKEYVLKPHYDKNTIVIVVICGNPREIMGLDNGFFQLSQMPIKFGNVYLITENEFYLLQKIFNEKR